MNLKKKKYSEWLNQMLLDLNYQHTDYYKHILPFTRNGILLDTSVMLIYIDGLIQTRFKKEDEPWNYKCLLAFFDKIKVNNRWENFMITPSILTEICNHVKNNNNRRGDYKIIFTEILSVLDAIKEKIAKKEHIIARFKKFNHFEIGDISISLVAEDILVSSEKIAILSKDHFFVDKYENDPRVMVMDFNKSVLGMTN